MRGHAGNRIARIEDAATRHALEGIIEHFIAPEYIERLAVGGRALTLQVAHPRINQLHCSQRHRARVGNDELVVQHVTDIAVVVAIVVDAQLNGLDQADQWHIRANIGAGRGLQIKRTAHRGQVVQAMTGAGGALAIDQQLRLHTDRHGHRVDVAGAHRQQHIGCRQLQRRAVGRGEVPAGQRRVEFAVGTGHLAAAGEHHAGRVAQGIDQCVLGQRAAQVHHFDVVAHAPAGRAGRLDHGNGLAQVDIDRRRHRAGRVARIQLAIRRRAVIDHDRVADCLDIIGQRIVDLDNEGQRHLSGAAGAGTGRHIDQVVARRSGRIAGSTGPDRRAADEARVLGHDLVDDGVDRRHATMVDQGDRVGELLARLGDTVVIDAVGRYRLGHHQIRCRRRDHAGRAGRRTHRRRGAGLEGQVDDRGDILWDVIDHLDGHSQLDSARIGPVMGRHGHRPIHQTTRRSTIVATAMAG